MAGMPIERQILGPCPRCQAANFTCSYNRFDRADLTILSWEHRCKDCGLRETKAYRSDQPAPAEEKVDPHVCPFCQRHSPD